VDSAKTFDAVLHAVGENGVSYHVQVVKEQGMAATRLAEDDN
jgi:hypothetical protein